MKTSKPILVVLAFFICLSLSAQEQVQLTKKDSVASSFWLVTLGVNFVDDSGDEFRELFDLREGWNAVPYPSRVSIGRYFKNGVGLEAIGTYNQYMEGKIVDDVVATEDVDYFGLDFRVSYDLNMILGDTGFFDPYVGIGAGYTDANNQGRGTYNAIIGFRTWFSDHWGLDFSSTGKWTMDSANSSNHVQHAVGVAYRFDLKKELTRKGEEKKALLEEMEREQQRIQDSIAAKQKADEEARLLAEKLEREKEAARLAAEKAKKDAEDARKAAIQNKIDNLGNVYFRLNSSYLASTDKILLDELAVIMEDNPGLVIEISGHTDSRGTDKYNQWLSERRVKRAFDYLILKKVDASRLRHEAFGETRLVNGCKDFVPCKEKEHQENRRVEFLILQL